MIPAERSLITQLDNRRKSDTYRQLTTSRPPIDFASNDYLGLSRTVPGQILSVEKINRNNFPIHGSGGSRLLTGNSSEIEELEKTIAEFHGAAAGLIFNSGYDANIGLMASIAQRGDTIISDSLIHASIIDGIRLSYANRLRFQHNNLVDLEKKLKNDAGNIYVIVESIYSMDGDVAPLSAITDLCERYNAALIVDEAHATGVIGEKGEGLVSALNLEDRVFARVITFGKALGCHGAIILGSETLRNFLINFARSFIYTTALPPATINSIGLAYQAMQPALVSLLKSKIKLFDNMLAFEHSCESAIRTIKFTRSDDAKNAAGKLQMAGFDVRAIVSPTVAQGAERLRICIHAFNSDQEIGDLASAIQTLKI